MIILLQYYTIYIHSLFISVCFGIILDEQPHLRQLKRITSLWLWFSRFALNQSLEAEYSCRGEPNTRHSWHNIWKGGSATAWQRLKTKSAPEAFCLEYYNVDGHFFNTLSFPHVQNIWRQANARFRFIRVCFVKGLVAFLAGTIGTNWASQNHDISMGWYWSNP